MSHDQNNSKQVGAHRSVAVRVLFALPLLFGFLACSDTLAQVTPARIQDDGIRLATTPWIDPPPKRRATHSFGQTHFGSMNANQTGPLISRPPFGQNQLKYQQHPLAPPFAYPLQEQLQQLELPPNSQPDVTNTERTHRPAGNEPTRDTFIRPSSNLPLAVPAQSVSHGYEAESDRVGPAVSASLSESLTPPRTTTAPVRNLPTITTMGSNQLGTFFQTVRRLPNARTDGEPQLASSLLAESSPRSERKTFKLAEQPEAGEHYHETEPRLDPRAIAIPFTESDFQPDPIYAPLVYDDFAQIDIYQGKSLNATQRPLIEWGRPIYFLGDVPESYTFLGETNLVAPRFLVYGDYRTAAATNDQNGNSQTVWAHRLNLDFDLKLTSTERFHAFTGPLDRGNNFTRGVYDNGSFNFFPELDPNFDTGFFEGDLGAIMGGLGNEVIPFDLPFAVGVMPLLFQNGIWMEDAFLGVAATIPARNSPALDISNWDTTFFAGFDRIDSPAFAGDDDAARMYGMASFIEAADGYFEVDYAYLEDRALIDRSYHNVGVGYSRRYGRLVSSSYRVIANIGQNPVGIGETADGALLLWENSLITSSPYTCVPYFNLFAGFGRPQSAARAAAAGGILRNTGINFESDGLTGYPTLDASGNDTYGGAFGLNRLSSNFDQQLVVEFAFLNTMGNDPQRIARGDQYGIGARYQIPISNAVIVRCDAMYGFLQSDNDISGVRVELRHKF